MTLVYMLLTKLSVILLYQIPLYFAQSKFLLGSFVFWRDTFLAGLLSTLTVAWYWRWLITFILNISISCKLRFFELEWDFLSKVRRIWRGLLNSFRILGSTRAGSFTCCLTTYSCKQMARVVSFDLGWVRHRECWNTPESFFGLWYSLLMFW